MLTFANVTDIRLDQQRAAVESFAVRTLEGTTLHVHAARYVLALGGIENARVLLASRSQQREGVANGHDVVGRYFMEHPHYYGSIGVVHPASLDLSFYTRAESDLKRSDGRPVEMLGALGLAAKVSRSEKLLNFSATFAGPRAGRPSREKTESDIVPSSIAQQLLMRGGGEAGTTQLTVRSEQSPLQGKPHHSG